MRSIAPCRLERGLSQKSAQALNLIWGLRAPMIPSSARDFSGSGPSQSKHRNVRGTFPPGCNSSVFGRRQVGQIRLADFCMVKSLPQTGGSATLSVTGKRRQAHPSEGRRGLHGRACGAERIGPHDAAIDVTAAKMKDRCRACRKRRMYAHRAASLRVMTHWIQTLQSSCVSAATSA